MKKIVFFILPVMLFLGCQPIYRTSKINTPLFHEQGETQVSLSGSTAGTTLQGAYSLTDNFALIANGAWLDRTNDTTSSEYNRHNLLEWGGGYYNHFGSGFVMEAFGGLGFGSAENKNSYWSDTERITNGKYQKYFLQPSVGYSGSVLDAGFTPRLTVVNYYEITNDNGPPIEAPGTDVFFEPAATVRLGYKYIKVSGQLGLAVPLSDMRYEYQLLNFSLGLHLNIARRFWQGE